METTNERLMREYPVQDDIWPSRRWNKDRTDYVDLSGHEDFEDVDLPYPEAGLPEDYPFTHDGFDTRLNNLHYPFTHDGYDTRLNNLPTLLVTGLVVAGVLAIAVWALLTQ